MQFEGLILGFGMKIEAPPAPPPPYYVRTFGEDLSAPGTRQTIIGGGKALVYDADDNLYATGLGYTSLIGNQGVTVKFNPDTTVDWQKFLSTGSTSDYTFLYSASVDNSNNLYVTGVVAKNWQSVTKTVTFQIAKYDSNGGILWQRDLGYGSSNSVPNFGKGVVVEKSTGDVYMVGDVLVGPSGSQVSDMTVVKYNSSGVLQWAKQIGNSGVNDHCNAVALDSAGNVYMVGSSILSSPAQSAAIVKYNSSGVLQWQKCLSGPTNGNLNQFNGIAIDSSDNIFVTGATYVGTLLVGMIVKYNSSGTLLWQRQIYDTSAITLEGVSVDSLGNVYAAGQTNVGGLIVKYDTNGVLLWQRKVTGNNQSLGPALINLYSIAFDSSGIMTVGGTLCPDQLRSNTNMFVLKVPNDGSLTGTYLVNEYDVTYAVDDNTEAELSQTPVTSTMPSFSVTYIDQGPSSLNESTSTFVDIITPIP